MRKGKTERDGLGPKGRQPKRVMPGTRSPGVNSHPRIPFSPPCHREGVARGDPLTLRKRTAFPSRFSRDTMDCRVGHCCSFLAMTIGKLHFFHFLHGRNHHPCHREGRKPVALHWPSPTEPLRLFLAMTKKKGRMDPFRKRIASLSNKKRKQVL